MVSSIDVCIVAAYLVFMLAIGFYTAKIPIRNLRDYALGNGSHFNYSLFHLSCTLVATAFGAGALFGDIGKIFQFGIAFCLFKCTVVPFYLIMSECLAPRMQPFLAHHDGVVPGFISTGDIMRHCYGSVGQLLTGLMGVIRSVGVLGAQVSAMGWLFHHVCGWHYASGILLGLTVVVVYTMAGGMRAITATDTLQLLIILLVLPIIANTAFCHATQTSGWGLFSFGGWKALWKAIPPSHKTWTPSSMSTLEFVVLLIIGISPFLEPHHMQRFLMARTAQDIQSTLRIGALAQLVLSVMIASVAFSMYILMPQCQPSAVLVTLLGQYTHSGFFGFCLVAILAAIMSTADSHLNVASVSFSHDVCKTLLGSRLSEKAELRLARLSTLGVGLLSGLAAVYCKDIRDLLIASLDAWGPTVTIPLWAGLLGYRASARTFMIAVLAGQVVYWGFPHCLPLGYKLSATLPAMLANAAAFALARRWDRPAAGLKL